MNTYTIEDVREMMLDGGFSEGTADFEEKYGRMKGWVKRGDGIAIYVNMDLGSKDAGHRKYVSFGSQDAQLEVEDDLPPTQLPDIGSMIHWRYQLEGVVPRPK